MATHRFHLLHAKLDTRDPDFRAKCVALMNRTRADMHETITHTEKTILSTRAFIAEANRLLAER